MSEISKGDQKGSWEKTGTGESHRGSKKKPKEKKPPTKGAGGRRRERERPNETFFPFCYVCQMSRPNASDNSSSTTMEKKRALIYLLTPADWTWEATVTYYSKLRPRY